MNYGTPVSGGEAGGRQRPALGRPSSRPPGTASVLVRAWRFLPAQNGKRTHLTPARRGLVPGCRMPPHPRSDQSEPAQARPVTPVPGQRHTPASEGRQPPRAWPRSREISRRVPVRYGGKRPGGERPPPTCHGGKKADGAQPDPAHRPRGGPRGVVPPGQHRGLPGRWPEATEQRELSRGRGGI
jgi:hypothetical protein